MNRHARRAAAIGAAIAAAAVAVPVAHAVSGSDVAVEPNGTAHFSWLKSDGSYALVQTRAWTPAGALGRVQWIPEIAGVVTKDAIAVDAGGRETIAYQQNDDFTQVPNVRRRRPDGSLGPVLRLNAPGKRGFLPDVAVGPDGDAVALWMEHTGEAKRVVRARRLSSSGVLGPILTVSSPTYDADQPRLAMSPDGTAIFTWRRFTPGPPTVVARALSPAGTLSPSQLVSYGAATSDSPRVGVDASGNAVFAWLRDFGGIRRVQTRRRSAGGTLSETLTLSSGNDTTHPDVAVDPTGRAALTWSQFDGTRYRAHGVAQAADGTRSSPAILSPVGAQALNTTVAIDADGNALFAWRRTDEGGDMVQVRRRSAAGAFGIIQSVSAAGSEATAPLVAMDADGDAVISWISNPDSVAYLQGRRRSAAGGLGDLEEIGY